MYEEKQEILAKLDYPFNSCSIGGAHNSWHATYVNGKKILWSTQRIPLANFFGKSTWTVEAHFRIEVIHVEKIPKWSFDHMDIILIALERRLVHLSHQKKIGGKSYFCGLGQPRKVDIHLTMVSSKLGD